MILTKKFRLKYGTKLALSNNTVNVVVLLVYMVSSIILVMLHWQHYPIVFFTINSIGVRVGAEPIQLQLEPIQLQLLRIKKTMW